MPSAFDAAWRKCSAAIDTVFGEPFAYQPMMPNPQGGRPIVDPSRPAMTIIGAATVDAMFAYPETQRGKGSVAAQQATQMITVDIAAAALPYEARTGDRLAQVATGIIYVVNGPQPDEGARIVLRVVKMSSGAP